MEAGACLFGIMLYCFLVKVYHFEKNTNSFRIKRQQHVLKTQNSGSKKAGKVVPKRKELEEHLAANEELAAGQ